MSERQTGRTTKQMREAPRGAVFVWCNGRTDYPRSLAASIGRRDLCIITPEDAREGRQLRGARHVVVDHEAHFSLSREAMGNIRMAANK